MKYLKYILVSSLAIMSTFPISSQTNRSSSTEVRRGNNDRTVPRSRDEENAQPAKTFNVGRREAPGANVAWMRMIYRELDLDNDKNATLYYPEDVIDGQENLFRIMLRLVANGEIPAFEYLDGREVFTPEFRVDVADLLNRFHIPYENAKGSTQKNPRYEINELDVPANEVLSYYILEKWEYDNRKNHTVATVEAICPILHRGGEFGDETLKYPMFWVPMESLRPYLRNTAIFVDDFDNNPRYSIDDYFTMNMYEGEIYKTRNVRNKSMMQLYPDEQERKHAADSIQKRLEQFDKTLWVPSREEVIAARQAKDEKESKLAAVPERKQKSESDRKPSRSSRAKKNNTGSSGSSSGAVRSVRDRKK